MQKEHVRVSKFLSLVLRHQPEKIHLQLDSQGWANVDELLQKADQYAGQQISRQTLQAVVETNDKQRFIFSSDGQCIRANQGHSIQVDLQLQPIQPPELLYHGTATRHIDAIRSQGLLPMQRQHVHLSVDTETAAKVGKRHGQLVILTVFADKMHQEGLRFYRSENGVWLTEHVAVEYLRFSE